MLVLQQLWADERQMHGVITIYSFLCFPLLHALKATILYHSSNLIRFLSFAQLDLRHLERHKCNASNNPQTTIINNIVCPRSHYACSCWHCITGPAVTSCRRNTQNWTRIVTTVRQVYAPVSTFLPPIEVAGALPRQNRRRGVPGKPTLSLSWRST